MILVLAHLDDTGAVRVFKALRERLGPHGVKLVSSEEIVMAPGWSHAVDPETTESSLRLADGGEVHDSALTLVFQRLRYLPMPHFALAAAADRDYATMEMHALVLSWLTGLSCPVINPPATQGLAGREPGFLEWMKSAGDAGLPTLAFRLGTNARRLAADSFEPHPPSTLMRTSQSVSSHGDRLQHPGRSPIAYLEPLHPQRRTAVVVGDQVLGDPPPQTKAACRRLARARDLSMLELEFGQGAGGWKFCGATSIPSIGPEAIPLVTSFLIEQSLRSAA